jgi:adenylate kinase
MRLLIVGPPGAGKGTQAARLAEHYGVPAISTGDIFRANITAKTPLGLEVEKVAAAGEYVADHITTTLVRDRLTRDDAKNGFLLDGYPRTPGQVEDLDAMLAESGVTVDVVVELMVDPEEIVVRLLERGQVAGRVDDTESTIRNRQALYHRETAPLAAIYRDRGQLVRIDGIGDVEAITRRLVAGIDEVAAARRAL